MLVNWPERFFCNSFVRRLQLGFEAAAWARARPMRPGAICLEIGCGNGFGAVHIAARFAPARLYALDPDPDMLALAVKRQIPPPTRAVFMKGDAARLPFPDACLDAVFNFGIMHHLEDWRAGVREAARTLLPGGALYIEEIFPALYAGPVLKHIVAHPRQDRFSPGQFLDALAENGLRLLPGYGLSKYKMLGVAVKTAAGSPLAS